MAVSTVLPRNSVDLLGLIGRDTRLRKVAGTGGGEYAGPCPDCGGKDRFRVQPERGLWWCRSCRDRWSDAIDYVRWRRGLSFPDACRELGIALDGRATATRTATRVPAAPPRPSLADESEGPSAAWRDQAERYVAFAERALWDDDWSFTAAKVRAWLMARGLSEDTIRRWHLGYQPSESYQRPEVWGLDGGKKIWLPRGIVIPWRLSGELWHVKIRRPEGEPKYVAVRGGHPVIFGAETLADHDLAVLLEGEFDAMLLEQECGDLVGVATLGSASQGLDPRAADELLGARVIFTLYDRDKAGERGAERLGGLTSRAQHLSVPGVKDATDYWKDGGDLRAWLSFELERLDLVGADHSAPTVAVGASTPVVDAATPAAESPATATAVAEPAPVTRPVQVCWGRGRGDIAVRDPWGEWHEIPHREAPPVWRAAVRGGR